MVATDTQPIDLQDGTRNHVDKKFARREDNNADQALVTGTLGDTGRQLKSSH